MRLRAGVACCLLLSVMVLLLPIITNAQSDQEIIQRIEELEQWIRDHPGVFDWNVHNELRHLYSSKNPPDLRKSMEHADAILQHSVMDEYILNILSGWQIGNDTSAARDNLLMNAEAFPDLRFIAAACFLKIGDLYTEEGNLEEAKSFYLKVAEDNSPDMAQYRLLAEERLSQQGQPPPAEETGPQWITPHEGATVPYPNDLVFEVTPVNGAVGYRFDFKENDQFVWGNESHEQHLDGTRYILPRDSPGHLALGYGANGQTSWPLQIWVRAYIQDGDQHYWTDASIINITLVGFGCIYGPGATCIDVLNPIPPNQWPSPDEVRAQLINIGMGTLCLGGILAVYVSTGPVGVLASLPFIITPDSPCVDPELVNEVYKQVMALFACIPKYSWEVCLLP